MRDSKRKFVLIEFHFRIAFIIEWSARKLCLRKKRCYRYWGSMDCFVKPMTAVVTKLCPRTSLPTVGRDAFHCKINVIPLFH